MHPHDHTVSIAHLPRHPSASPKNIHAAHGEPQWHPLHHVEHHKQEQTASFIPQCQVLCDIGIGVDSGIYKIKGKMGIYKDGYL